MVGDWSLSRYTLRGCSTSVWLLSAAVTAASLVGEARAAGRLTAVRAAASEARHDLHGYVVDGQSGEALPYATVSLKGRPAGAITNVDGYFVIVDAPAVVCTLQVSFIGYAWKETAVDNSRVRSQPLRIQLEVAVIDLEQTVVTAEEEYQIWRPADEVSQVSFSPRQLDYLPTLGEADVFRSLQLLPGISGVSDGSSGLYIRGGTPDQNLVILDGMTVYHVDHFFGMFSAFNADAVKDLQVYKGGYPAKYGGRLSSVVELTGKTGDVNRLQLGVGGNLLSSHALLEVPLWGRGSWVLSARRSYTDLIESGLYTSLFDLVDEEQDQNPAAPAAAGFGGRRRGRTLRQQVEPSFYFYDLNSKVALSPTPIDFLAVSLYSGRDNLAESQELSGVRLRDRPQASEDESGSRTQENLTDWGNLGASLKWGRQWHARLFTNMLVSSSVYSSDYLRDRSFRGASAGNQLRVSGVYRDAGN